MPDRIEIKPRKGATIAKFLALEAFLIPASLYTALQRSDPVMRSVGVFALLFFGFGGLIALYRMSVRTWSFAISDAGLEIPGTSLPWNGTRDRRVAWRDVEAVGIADVSGQKMVGVRLSSYEAYSAGAAGSAAPARGDARRRLLQANRALCGYDLCFPWSDLDRSPRDMVDLLSRYRQASMPGSST